MTDNQSEQTTSSDQSAQAAADAFFYFLEDIFDTIASAAPQPAATAPEILALDTDTPPAIIVKEIAEQPTQTITTRIVNFAALSVNIDAEGELFTSPLNHHAYKTATPLLTIGTLSETEPGQDLPSLIRLQPENHKTFRLLANDTQPSDDIAFVKLDHTLPPANIQPAPGPVIALDAPPATPPVVIPTPPTTGEVIPPPQPSPAPPADNGKEFMHHADRLTIVNKDHLDARTDDKDIYAFFEKLNEILQKDEFQGFQDAIRDNESKAVIFTHQDGESTIVDKIWFKSDLKDIDQAKEKGIDNILYGDDSLGELLGNPWSSTWEEEPKNDKDEDSDKIDLNDIIAAKNDIDLESIQAVEKFLSQANKKGSIILSIDSDFKTAVFSFDDAKDNDNKGHEKSELMMA